MSRILLHTFLLSCFLLPFFCGFQQLHAQDPTLSQNEQFRVDYVKGCVPFTVTVIEDYVLDGFPETHTRAYRLLDQNRSHITDWDTLNSYTINSPGTFFIEQQVQNRLEDDIIEVTGIAADPVPFTMMNCGLGIASIEFIPEENTYSAFEVLPRRSANDTEEISHLIEPDGDGKFKGEVPFSGTGEYLITLKGLITEPDPGTNDNGCWTTTFTFTVYNDLAPATFTQLQAYITPEEDTAGISHDLAQDVGYILEYKENETGSFQPLQDISGPATNPGTFTEFDFQENFYCFRARTVNPCDETTVNNSELVCTAKLQANPAADGNLIIFETGSGTSLQEASLLRKASGEITWRSIHSFGAAIEGDYLDTDITCDRSYQYAIELVYTGGMRSFTEGLPLINEAGRSLPAPTNISSSWNDNAFVTFSVADLKNREGVNLRALRANDETRLVDEADTSFILLPAAGRETCYRFQYTDACGNASQVSEAVCAIYLNNEASEPDGLLLQWNAYTGFADGVAYYEVVKYDPDGNSLGRTPMGTQITLDLGLQELNESGMQYEVVAYPNNVTIPPSTSNLFLFEIEMEGYFPNAFSPGSESENAIFTVQGKFVKSLNLQIFNRWGGLIYQTNDKETGWDGTANGNPAPSGTYMYRAIVTTQDDRQQTYQGAVFLLRK